MKKIKVTILSILFFVKIFGQSNATINSGLQDLPVLKDSIPVIIPAGKQFKASAWKSFWWGDHYRKEWATPVAFPVLNLATFAGGLKPDKAGGGHESKSLRLIGANGKEYVLRTVDKNLDMIVPDNFRGSFINTIVNDQVCTAHPYGPVAIASMAGTLSLFHTNPVIYYVPNDPGLLQFRNVFANKLCLLEERPSGKGWEHTDIFGNGDDIINTDKMLGHVFASSKNAVDQNAFLRVRLFDMIVNDWDRHEDQWVWVVKKSGGHHVYTPIARDRDQAFSKTDGISLRLVSGPWGFRSLQNMTSHIRDIRGANFSARNLDQQFFSGLAKGDWENAIEFIQTRLTDSSIQKAVYAMPEEVNKISGEFLTRRLIQRRDHLMKDGMRYYTRMSKRVTINGSANNEQFIINKNNKNEVSVTGLRPGNDTFYYRVFDRHETKEINIYGLEGDDEFFVNGNAKNRFVIRLIGGEGVNRYRDNNSASGRLCKVYDSLHLSDLSKRTFWVNRHWDTLYRYKRASVKYDWFLPLIVPGYNPDDGLSIGLGVLYKKQTWGKTPFGWQQSLLIDYATKTRAVGFAYTGLFKQTFGKWDFEINTFYKGPRYTFNYYGRGNETGLNNHDRSYFRVKADNFYINPGVSRAWKLSELHFGLQYEMVKIFRSQEKFVTSTGSPLDSSVFSAISFAGVNGQWKISTQDDIKYRTKGVEFQTGISYFKNTERSNRNMLNVYGAISLFHTFFKRLTFSHRTGAATIFGDYEFYQANTLGSNNNLRGFWRDRFSGKSDFYQNTELRFRIADLKGYVFRGKFGVFGFIDDGKVWIEDEHSSKLHVGYGGGIFLVPFNLGTLTLSYAGSSEASMVILRAGFFF